LLTVSLVVAQLDGIPVTLAHFPVVEAGERGDGSQERLRFDKHVTKKLIEATNRFARKLEVDDLILADGNEIRVVHRHDGGLQQRIAEESQSREIFFGELLLLILVSGHALEPGNRDHHREE
jgi:hypothetical protein